MKSRAVVVVVAMGAGVVVACAGPALDVAGDAMVEVGDAISVLGDAVSDVGHLGMGDAAAAPVEYEVDCVRQVNAEASTVYPDGHGSRYVLAYWTAVVRDPAIHPGRVVSAGAVACGRVTENEVFPVPGPVTCPDGASCTQTSDAFPDLDCYAFGGVAIEPGAAMVICGTEQETETLGPGGTRLTYNRSVNRRTTARFVIDQR